MSRSISREARPRVWTVDGIRVRILDVTPDTPAVRAHLRRRISRSLANGVLAGSGGTIGASWRWDRVRDEDGEA